MGGGRRTRPFSKHIHTLFLFEAWMLKGSQIASVNTSSSLFFCVEIQKTSASWRSGATRSSNFWNGYAFVPQKKKKCYICIYHHLVYFTLLSTREKSICWRSAQGSPWESSNCSLFSKHGEIIWTHEQSKKSKSQVVRYHGEDFVVPLSNVKRSNFEQWRNYIAKHMARGRDVGNGKQIKHPVYFLNNTNKLGLIGLSRFIAPPKQQRRYASLSNESAIYWKHIRFLFTQSGPQSSAELQITQLRVVRASDGLAVL